MISPPPPETTASPQDKRLPPLSEAELEILRVEHENYLRLLRGEIQQLPADHLARNEASWQSVLCETAQSA